LTAYVDTSVLVAALTAEVKTPDVQTWLAAQSAGELVISDWVSTEFSSALSLKLRTGQITVKQRADALALFNQFRTESLVLLPVSPLHFRMAAQMADNHALGLRAGDALHLAVAADVGAILVTLDQTQAAAGEALGVPTGLPSSP